MIVINFKAYKEATGENAVRLAELISSQAENSGIRIIIVPQAVDIVRVSDLVETFAQHIDPFEPGARTGSTLAESVKAAGATGSFLNHSEKRIPPKDIEDGIRILRRLGMESIVCTKDPDEGASYAQFSPDYIAIEPPELIGTGVSVSKAKPEVVTESIKKVKAVNPNVKVLCGAGISNGEDVKKALELGVDGVMFASAFVKSENPTKVLDDMIGGFK